MPDRFGKISIHNIPAAAPTSPESIEVENTMPPPKPGKPTKEKKRRPSRPKTVWLFWLGGLLGVFLLYLAAGFVVIPRYLASSLHNSVKESSSLVFEPGTIAFNPLTFHFSVAQAKLSDASGNPLASLSRLDADLAPISLLRLDLVCNTVTLSELTLHLARENDGSYNFSHLNQKNAGEGAADLLSFSELPFFFSLNNIVVKEGRILFSDKPTGKTHTIEKLHLELPSFSNIPFQSNQYLRPRFSAVINGSPVELSGQAFVGEGEEGATTLSANLHELELPLYAEYLPSPLPLIFTGGKVDGKVDFIFDPANKEEDRVAIDFDLQLSAVELNTSEETLFVTAPKTDISGRILPMSKAVAFKNISSTKPAFHTTGTSLLASLDPLFKKDKAEPGAAGGAVSDTALPPFKLENLTIEDGSFHLWETRGAKQPKTSWDGLLLHIKGYDATAPGEKASDTDSTFSLQGGEVGSSATFTWQGNLAPSGSQVGELSLKDFDLAELLKALGADDTFTVSGQAYLTGNLTLSPPEKAGDTLTFRVADAELKGADVKVFEGKSVIFEAPSIQCTSLATTLKTIHFGKVSIDSGAIYLQTDKIPSALRSFSGGRYLLQELRYHGQLTLQKDEKDKNKSLYSDLTIAAQNLDTLEKAKENFSLSAKTPHGGSIDGRGDLRLAPFSANLDATFSGLAGGDILPLVTYSPLLAGVSGTLSGKGNFGFPKIGFTGDLAISKGSMKVPNHQPLSWSSLSLQGLNYTSEPLHLGVVEAKFEQPQFSWQLGKDEQGPLGQLASFLRQYLPDPPPQPKGEEGSSVAVSTVGVQAVSFEDGSVMLHDPRLKPKWQGKISSVSGKIEDINSSKLSEGSSFSFTGSLQDTPFTLKGNLNVFSSDDPGAYQFALDNYPLSNLQEQLASLSEISIKNGLCSLTLDAGPKDGQLHQSGTLTVGEVKATSPSSDSALALALLTDNNDTFTLDFDFSGAAASGKTALVEELLSLFQTKTIKAAVSPLLLASGDYTDLIGNEFIAFDPGQATLSDSGKAILGRYVELLQSHPLLGLELSGGIDRDADTPILKEHLMIRERQRVEEENRKRYQEWLREREIFEQKVAEQQKKQAAKGKTGEPPPPPAVLKDYLPLQPKTVNVDNAMLLDLAKKRVQLLLQQFSEQHQIAADRLTIEPLKKIPSDPEMQNGPWVKVSLISTK
jgi:Domain of Unknown Function (DUF748)